MTEPPRSDLVGSSARRFVLPPAPPSSATITVPTLMHELGGVVVADGTLVAFRTADKLFDGATAVLHADAPGRLNSLVQLIRQINPSCLRVTVRTDGDSNRGRFPGEVVALSAVA